MVYNCLEKARHFLEDYTDEIPREILHNIHSTHKVSGGWLHHVGSLFYFAHKKGLVDESYKTEMKDHVREIMLNKRLRNGEDIKFENNLLERFIKEIS